MCLSMPKELPRSCSSPCDSDSLPPNLFLSLSLSFITSLPFHLLISRGLLFLLHYFCQAASLWLSLSLASSLLSFLSLFLQGYSVLTPSRCSQREGPNPPTLPQLQLPSPSSFLLPPQFSTVFIDFSALHPF